jgi:hypothetical protein
VAIVGITKLGAPQKAYVTRIKTMNSSVNKHHILRQSMKFEINENM